MTVRGPFVILTILSLQRGIGVLSLLSDDQNHKSVCQQYHRINETQQVSYVETYYRREWQDYTSVIASRVNFRTEIISKWKVVEMCCEGYKPHQLAENAEECVPVCFSGCENGECYRPNTCKCNPGYSVFELNGYSECLPYCDSGCTGGTCVAPNTCTCNTGYVLVNNETSCEPSCIGIGAGGPQDCGDNAICLAPNTCQCNDGYAPETHHLWVEIDNTEKPTFHTNDTTCRPQCKPECVRNASCTAPNWCQCDLGYNWKSSDAQNNESQCLPICEHTCLNGFCKHPNQCSCHEGYKPHQLFDSNICEPICQDYCVNGKCTVPNHCECLDGYEKLIVITGNYSKISANVCIPVCPGRCSNGSCIAPGQCHCNPGYVLVSSEPEETTESSLYPGVVESSSSSLINLSRQTCLPFCEPRCNNGSICVAPNQCQAQPPVAKDFIGYPMSRTRIVNSRNDCGSNGIFFEDNGSCMCNYDLHGQRCIEPLLCAVIFTNDTESVAKFGALERFGFLDNTGIRTVYNSTTDRNNEVGLDTELARCEKECRITILSNEIPNDFHKNAKHCHQLELYNATTGLLSDKLGALPTMALRKNESLLCFVNARFGCNTTQFRKVDGRIGGIIGGALGVILLVAFIVAIGLSIYLTRRKIWNIRLFREVSERNDNMMERSEATDSPFHTDDSSHL